MSTKNDFLVLLIEDDIDDYQLFVDAVSKVPDKKFSIVWKCNGAEAMLYLKTEDIVKPHYVILDLNLPLKDGFQTLWEIKAEKKLQHLTVIIFTTSIHLDYINKCWTDGCNGYFLKPNTGNEYERCVVGMFADYKSN